MMRKAILAFVLTAVSAMSVWAQVKTEIAGAIQPATTVPSGACTRRNAIRTYANKIYICPQSGTMEWSEIGGSAVVDASTTVKGVIEIATQAELEARSDTGRAVTPALVGTQRGKHRVYTYANLITYTSTYPDGATVEDGDEVRVSDNNRGFYRWNSTASKWISVNGGAYSPLDWGVKGDNATNDTAAWATFLAAIPDYATIILPNGFKSLAANIDLSGRKGLYFQGTNAGAEAASTHALPVLKMTGAAGGTLITCSPCQSIVFEGFMLDGANLADKLFNASYNGSPTYDVTFRRMHLAAASGGGAARSSYIAIDWCGTGTTSNCERLVVENSTVSGTQASSICVRVGHSNSLNNSIEGNNIGYCGQGVRLTGTAAVKRNLFDHNILDISAQLAESIEIAYNRTENAQQFFNGNVPVNMHDNVFGTHDAVTADAWIDNGKTSTDAFTTFTNNVFVNDDTLPPFSTGLTSSLISKHNRYPTAAVSNNRVTTMANFGRGFSSEGDTYLGGAVFREDKQLSAFNNTLIDASNNTTLNVLNLLRRTSSGSAPAAGMGGALNFQILNSSSAIKDAARIGATWTSAGAGAETAYLSGSITNSGTLTEYWRWLPGGLRAVAAGQDFGSATQAMKDIYLYGSGTYGSHSIKFTGAPTGNVTQTFPDNSGTVANLNLAQTWTASQSMNRASTSVTLGKIFQTAASNVWFNGLIAGDDNYHIYGYGISGGLDAIAIGATTGNVGIGITPSGARLHAAAGTVRIMAESTTNGANSAFSLRAKSAAGTQRDGGLFWFPNDTTALSYFCLSADNATCQLNVLNSGKVGVGVNTTTAAWLHVIGTTEQLRVGYDASNYLSATIGSTGTATLTPTGTNPTLTIGATLSLTNAAVTATNGGTTTLNLSTGNLRTVTMPAGDTTITASNVPVGTVVIAVIQDGGGSRLVTWNSLFKFAGGAAPTLTTTGGARDQLWFSCDGTNCYELARALDVR